MFLICHIKYIRILSPAHGWISIRKENQKEKEKENTGCSAHIECGRAVRPTGNSSFPRGNILIEKVPQNSKKASKKGEKMGTIVLTGAEETLIGNICDKIEKRSGRQMSEKSRSRIRDLCYRRGLPPAWLNELVEKAYMPDVDFLVDAGKNWAEKFEEEKKRTDVQR